MTHTDSNLHATAGDRLHVRAWPGTETGPYVSVAVALPSSTTTTYLSPALARDLADRLVRAADEAERRAREGVETGVAIEPAVSS